MTSNVTYVQIGILSSIIFVLIFFLIEVLGGQLVVSLFVERNIENTSVTVSIIMFGFLLGILVALFTTNLLNEKLDKREKRVISLLTFSVNIQLWFYIVLISTDKYFNIPVSERLLIIDKVFLIYALTELSNPTLLWIYSGITYSILYTFFLYYYKVEEQDDYT